jgi:ribose 5-phosphate isomerase B
MKDNTSSGTKIALASDHAGFQLKELVKKHLISRGLEAVDLGAHSEDSVDYPDYAHQLAETILEGEAESGVLFCGAGLGMSMAANRHRGIRAALCHDHYTASVSRRHNDANVLVLGGRILGPDLAREIVDTWLDTPFEGGRHLRRVERIDK